MADNRFVGSLLARISTVLLGVLTVSLSLATDGRPRYVLYGAVVAGVMTWISLVHAIRPLFKLWMRFAEAVHTVGVTTIFAACYLIIVPLFRAVVWFRDPLHLRRQPGDTAWVTRTAVVDAASLERMG